MGQTTFDDPIANTVQLVVQKDGRVTVADHEVEGVADPDGVIVLDQGDHAVLGRESQALYSGSVHG